MITVKFFGLLSVNYAIKKIEMKEGKVQDVLNQVIRLYPEITEKQLKQSIMIINQKQVSENKRFAIELQSGDELVFLNPSSGG